MRPSYHRPPDPQDDDRLPGVQRVWLRSEAVSAFFSKAGAAIFTIELESNMVGMITPIV